MPMHKCLWTLATFSLLSSSLYANFVASIEIQSFSGTNDSTFSSGTNGNEHHLTGSHSFSESVSASSYVHSVQKLGTSLATYGGVVVWQGLSKAPRVALVQVQESAMGYADHRTDLSGNPGNLFATPQSFFQSNGESMAFSKVDSTFNSGSTNKSFVAFDPHQSWSIPPFAQYLRQLTGYQAGTWQVIDTRVISVPISYNSSTNDYRGTFTYGYSQSHAEISALLSVNTPGMGPHLMGLSGGNFSVNLTKKVEVVGVTVP